MEVSSLDGYVSCELKPGAAADDDDEVNEDEEEEEGGAPRKARKVRQMVLVCWMG